MREDNFGYGLLLGRSKRRECREKFTPRVLHESHAEHLRQNEQVAQVLRIIIRAIWWLR